MNFDSYYWHKSPLSNPELQRARALVATGDPNAFEQLVRSDDEVALGIAFDQFHHADALTRHGAANAFAPYRDELIARAREVLRGAPSAAREGVEAGANHASALGALANFAQPEDAELIIRAIGLTQTPNLRFAAALAAGSAFGQSAPPDERLIATLVAIVLDDTAGRDARRASLAALGRAHSEAATDALLRTLHVADPSLQASAALLLLDRDRRVHRARVADLARSWPTDPPYPADEVLELLAEPDEP